MLLNYLYVLHGLFISYFIIVTALPLKIKLVMGRLRLSLLFSVPKNAFETLFEEEGTQKKKRNPVNCDRGPQIFQRFSPLILLMFSPLVDYVKGLRT